MRDELLCSSINQHGFIATVSRLAISDVLISLSLGKVLYKATGIQLFIQSKTNYLEETKTDVQCSVLISFLRKVVFMYLRFCNISSCRPTIIETTLMST